MAFTKIEGIKLSGIVSLFPKNEESNAELSFLSSDEADSLIKHTGIRQRRRVKNKSVSLVDTFAIGVEELLNLMQWQESSVDVLVVVNQSNNNYIPSIACQLQGNLSLSENAIAFDINLGCSGFVYGLHTISNLLKSLGKSNAKAVFCCGDFTSQLTEESDKTVRPIFSDALAFTALEYDITCKAKSYFHLQTFGKGQRAIALESSDKGESFMRLNGIDVFNYSIKYVPKNIEELFSKYNLQKSDTDLYILHQANNIINKKIVSKLGVEEIKAPSTLSKYGNTASASIPLTFSTQKVKTNSTILFSGFGVGFSVGSCLMENVSAIPTKTIELDI